MSAWWLNVNVRVSLNPEQLFYGIPQGLCLVFISSPSVFPSSWLWGPPLDSHRIKFVCWLWAWWQLCVHAYVWSLFYYDLSASPSPPILRTMNNIVSFPYYKIGKWVCYKYMSSEWMNNGVCFVVGGSMSLGTISMSLRCSVLMKQSFHHKSVSLLTTSKRKEPVPYVWIRAP